MTRTVTSARCGAEPKAFASRDSDHIFIIAPSVQHEVWYSWSASVIFLKSSLPIKFAIGWGERPLRSKDSSNNKRCCPKPIGIFLCKTVSKQALVKRPSIVTTFMSKFMGKKDITGPAMAGAHAPQFLSGSCTTFALC